MRYRFVCLQTNAIGGDKAGRATSIYFVTCDVVEIQSSVHQDAETTTPQRRDVESCRNYFEGAQQRILDVIRNVFSISQLHYMYM
jgi:hypothetical protein